MALKTHFRNNGSCPRFVQQLQLLKLYLYIFKGVQNTIRFKTCFMDRCGLFLYYLFIKLALKMITFKSCWTHNMWSSELYLQVKQTNPKKTSPTQSYESCKLNIVHKATSYICRALHLVYQLHFLFI